MTNSYDAADTDDGRFQPPIRQEPATKGQLNLALRSSIQEAQSLANYYANLAKTLELLAAQVEHTK